MSLQVWLPLNGNLNNQGIGEYTFTSTATFGLDGGKMCSGYKNGGAITANKSPMGLEGTVAFWIYVDSNTSTSNGNLLYGNSSTAAATNNRKWSLFLYPNIYSVHSWGCMSDDSTSYSGSYTVSNCLSDGWNHVAVAHDKKSQYIYINGILKSTVAWTYNSSLNYTFDVSTVINGNVTGAKFNDFRIYDNCLSAREIKEISRCLVLHYPLKQPERSVNLCNSSSGVFTGTVPSSNYSDFKAYSSITTVNANEQYTLSFEAKASVDGIKLTNYFYNNSSGIVQVASMINSQGSTATGSDGNSNLTLTTDYKKYWVIWTFNGTTTSALKTLLFRLIYSPNSSNVGETVDIKNIKLEKGYNTSPQWSPSPSDANNWGLIEYDCSGFGNNGNTTSATAPIWSCNSPRYNGCYYFDTSTKTISIPRFVSTNQTIEDMTVSCWFKTNTLNDTAPNIISLGDNSFFRYRLGSSSSIWYYIRIGNTQCGNTFWCKTLTDNTWHLSTVVVSKGIVKIYIDGDLIGTGDHSSIAKYMTCGGGNSYCLAGYTETSEKFIGSLSDCRIYMTALSDDDIKELYTVSLSIDNQGNLFCGEVVE